MDVEEKLTLIKEVGEEIIGEDELRAMLSDEGPAIKQWHSVFSVWRYASQNYLEKPQIPHLRDTPPCMKDLKYAVRQTSLPLPLPASG